MKYLILSIISCLAFASCIQTPQERNLTEKLERERDLQTPEKIGVLKDGREIIRYKIYNARIHDHYVYVVGDTISINHAVPSGKTTTNAVEVIIDGVKYIKNE